MNKIKEVWGGFKEKHPGVAQFIVFFVLSNGVTLLQLVLMPMIKEIFNGTDLVNTAFQWGQVGSNVDGSAYYIFNYPAGSIASGGGGGLAYFLAVQITLAIAQVINFFAQRNITFKSNTNIYKAALWYFIAYIFITIGAAAAQGFYKVPVYEFFMTTLNLGSLGITIADFITMFINSAISFWVFFPIFKIIFKREEESEEK